MGFFSEHSVEPATSPDSGWRESWTVTLDGCIVTRPDGGVVDLTRRRTLRRLLLTLSARRIDGDGRPVLHDDLIDAAWPGDRSRRASALNRLAFSISELRRLGLRELILRTPGGYVLAPDAKVAWADSELMLRPAGS
jgi:hypothetical protein